MLQMLGLKGAAEWLTKHGIKGEPGKPDHCVLAEYFQRQTGETDIRVAGDIQVKGFSFPCPPILRQLWGKFDRKELPDLVGKPVRREQEVSRTE